MNYELNKKEIEEILAKKNLEQYIFSDNPFIAYLAAAFAGHGLLYKLIQLGSIEQKINVVEHGSSKHLEILLNDYSSIIRDRASIKAAELESNILHEYVTSEKFKMIFSENIPYQPLFFFERETNFFLQEIYYSSIKKEHLLSLFLLKNFTDKVLEGVKLTKDELAYEKKRSIKKTDPLKQAKKSKELIYKYGFSYELFQSYGIGVLSISRANENIFNAIINYDYYNETNPFLFNYIWENIIGNIADALAVYDVSLDKFHFDSIEKFYEHKNKRLIMKKLGFTKKELLDILEYSKSLLGDQDA